MMISWIHSILSRFGRDKRANVAMITAVCAIPMFGMIGFGIDYGTALTTKSKLDAAADEAAIVAIKTVQTVMQGGGAFSSGQTQGIAQAQAAFKAGAGRLGSTTVPSISPRISQSGQTISATITYTAPVAANFSKIVGISTVNIAGTSVSSLALTTYIRVYVIVDVSQSMGIGTDATNMQALYNRVVANNNGSGGETGCVFGCHVLAAGQTYTNEYLAHNSSFGSPITLRIDSAITAIQDIITQAQSAAGTNGNIQIGLYTMGLYPVTGSTSTMYLNTVAAPTTNFSTLTTAAASIDLGNNTSGGLGDSTFSTSLSNFYTTVLGSQGTGASASSPVNYVFLVTDGVQDVFGSSCTSTHCVQALDPTICTNIKNQATLGVIYTTYNPIYVANNSANGYESNYYNLVYPIAGNVLTNLQACATSSTYFYQATDGTDIINDMSALFASTMQQARITQ